MTNASTLRPVRVLALMLAGALVLLASTPAAAHTYLVSSEPGADSTVDEPLEMVVLVFNEPVQTDFAEVGVTDEHGTSVIEGPARVEGERALQDLVPLEETGEYTVTYRVIARDGHPVEGSFEFTYDGPLPEEPEPTDEPTPADTPEAHAATPRPTPTPSPDAAHEAETDHDAEETAAAAPAGPSGDRWPLGLAGLVVLVTVGAAAYAVRALRRWPAPEPAPAGPE